MKNLSKRIIVVVVLTLLITNCKEDEKGLPQLQACNATENIISLQLPVETYTNSKSVVLLENGKLLLSAASQYYIYSNDLELESSSTANGGKRIFPLSKGNFLSFDEEVISTPVPPFQFGAFYEVGIDFCFNSAYVFLNGSTIANKDSTYTKLYFHEANTQVINTTTIDGILFDVKTQGGDYIFLSVKFPGQYPRPVFDTNNVFQDTVNMGFSDIILVISKFTERGDLVWQKTSSKIIGTPHFENYNNNYSLGITDNYIWVFSHVRLFYQFSSTGDLLNVKRPFLDCDEDQNSFLGSDKNNRLYIGSRDRANGVNLTYYFPEDGDYTKAGSIIYDHRSGKLLNDALYYSDNSKITKFSLDGQKEFEEPFSNPNYYDNKYLGADCSGNLFMINQAFNPDASYVHKISPSGELPNDL